MKVFLNLCLLFAGWGMGSPEALSQVYSLSGEQLRACGEYYKVNQMSCMEKVAELPISLSAERIRAGRIFARDNQIIYLEKVAELHGRLSLKQIYVCGRLSGDDEMSCLEKMAKIPDPTPEQNYACELYSPKFRRGCLDTVTRFSNLLSPEKIDACDRYYSKIICLKKVAKLPDLPLERIHACGALHQDNEIICLEKAAVFLSLSPEKIRVCGALHVDLQKDCLEQFVKN